MIENINLNGSTVSAELHGFMYNNVWGYTGVFKYGSAMAAEIVSNNEIKIKDGLLCNYGRFMRINGYETVSIENGTSGVSRVDLIVAHFETDGINETHDLRVIKGPSGGAIPAYTTGDIYNGDTINELPLYAVHLNGLSVDSLTQMFIPLFSLDELRNNFSNPNLLINSDFRNPINQRGETSYTGNSIYTIDRWMISANETLTIEDGFIRFTLNSEQAYLLLQQKVEMNKSSVPDVMTLSCKIRASQKAKFHLYDTDRFFEVGTDWEVLTITFTKEEIQSSASSLQDDHFRVYIGIKDYDNPNVDNLPAGSYVDIEWAKLEVGSVSTPLVNRPYAAELALCQRYFEVIPYAIARILIASMSSISSTFASSYVRIINGAYAVTKRSTPTVTIKGDIKTAEGSVLNYNVSNISRDQHSVYTMQFDTTNSYFDITINNIWIESEIY